jgi:hypothetical protein
VAYLFSQPVYSAGSAWQLYIKIGEPQTKGRQRDVGVYMYPCEYWQGRTQVARLRSPLACSFTISRSVPGQAEPKRISGEEAATLTAGGWGRGSIFEAASPSDLEPHLVGGCLKLQASVRIL